MLGGLQISCYAGLAKWCVVNTELAVNRGDESDTTRNDGGGDRGALVCSGRIDKKSRPFRKFSLSYSCGAAHFGNSGIIR